ncbi:Acyltransferase family protein [Asanoa ishikariensis]|uniref:Acyltransferase family protein n=2 Tax=Asanoa ishikariensis TaxID=137265 RepID=A0A1H3TRN0_9ACTN|nr:Acyltransferase family protein [Asanoa ishikariensis]
MATMGSVTRVERLPHVDNLRAVMVAWIIGGHALLGYSAIGGWPYDEVQETTFHPKSELAMAVVVGPTGLFVIGTFFFIAGLFAPAAMARKGPGKFVSERLVRLGVPFLLFALLVWPLFMWFAYLAAGYQVSFWWEFTHRHPFLDSGPLWFAEILLYVSLAYAALVWARDRARADGRADDSDEGPTTLGGRQLVTLVAMVALASFLIRLWFPAQSKQVLDLHVWQWPQCVAMFGLGVAAARFGWAKRVPERLRRGCGVAVIITVVALPLYAWTVGISDLANDAGPYQGGWHWQALLLATVEAVLVVAGSVWVLGLAQDRLQGVTQLWRRCARGSFAAFVLQAPVLLTLAIMLRPFDLPAEAKAIAVAGIGIPVCFWLAWKLIERTPVGRYL